jgi:hypothetical protein
MATYRISRQQVKATLDIIASSPWRVFRALVVRRSDLFLRYPPINQTENGPYVRIGDHSKVGQRGFIYGIDGSVYRLTDKASNRRFGEKILLQAAGETRWIACINYDRDKGNGSKHAPAKTDRGRNYDPLEYDLYPLAGFYSDQLKLQPNGFQMLGRFGQWRPYVQICLRGIIRFKALGHTWIVTDPPQNVPIQYSMPTALTHSRRHVVTASGEVSRGRMPVTDEWLAGV